MAFDAIIVILTLFRVIQQREYVVLGMSVIHLTHGL